MILPQEMMAGAPLAMMVGGAGLAGQLAWPLFRRRETILTAQLGIAVCYAGQYALLGQKTGALVCLVGAIQTTVALLAGDRPFASKLGYGFIPLVLALGLMTWGGPASALALTASCLVMLGRMQRDTLRMRGVMLAATPFCIAFDLCTGAIPALIGALLSATMAATGFRREWRERIAPSLR